MILLKIVVMLESLVMSLGIERFDLMCLHTEFRLTRSKARVPRQIINRQEITTTRNNTRKYQPWTERKNWGSVRPRTPLLLKGSV